MFEGCKTFRCKPQLSAVRKSNVAVTGKGIIDGAGDIWRLGKKNEMPPMVWNECIQMEEYLVRMVSCGILRKVTIAVPKMPFKTLFPGLRQWRI